MQAPSTKANLPSIPDSDVDGLPDQLECKTKLGGDLAEVYSQVPPHSLSPNVARKYGVFPAVLFEFVRYSSPWTGTLAKLLEVYPYVGRRQMRNAIEALEGGVHDCEDEELDFLARVPLVKCDRSEAGVVLRLTKFGRRAHGRGGSRQLHWFDPLIAAATGGNIVAALVHWSMASYICDRIDLDGHQAGNRHYEGGRRWQEHHPYVALRTAQRAFQALVGAGLIERIGGVGDEPEWALNDGPEVLYLDRIKFIKFWRGKKCKHSKKLIE